MTRPLYFPGFRDPLGLPAIASENDLDLTYASAYFSGGNEAISYSVGLDHLHEDADSESFVDLGFAVLPAGFEVERDTTGVFFEIAASLSSTLDLIVAGRHDNSSGG